MNSDAHNEFGSVNAPVKRDGADWRQGQTGIFGTVKRFLRYLGLLALSAISFATLGVLYLLFATVTYSATATVMFVPNAEQFRNQSLFEIDIETHKALIESDEILTRILEGSPFAASSGGEGFAVGTINDIRDVLERPPLTVSDKPGSDVDAGNTTSPAEPIADSAVLAALRQRVDVQRVGQSKLLNISFKAEDPSLAVSMANKLAQTYSANSINPNMPTPTFNTSANLRVQELLQNRGIGGPLQGAETNSNAPERSNIQIVKLASLASAKSSPQANVVLAVSLTLGLIVGLTALIGLELRKEEL